MSHVDRSLQRDYVLARWSKLATTAAKKNEPLGVFGAGQHTRWLLEQLSPCQRGQIAVVLDDNAKPGSAIEGIPLANPRDFDARGLAVVVVSSDQHERKLVQRAREVFGRSIPIERIYTRARFVTIGARSFPAPRSKISCFLKNIIFGLDQRWQLTDRFVTARNSYQNWRFWHSNGVNPHWADHRIDLALWSKLRNPEFVERGVYAREMMRPDCSVLDLCCGDGFYILLLLLGYRPAYRRGGR